eukprot:363681-Chlamydomonas_euryale.AAC.11
MEGLAAGQVPGSCLTPPRPTAPARGVTAATRGGAPAALACLPGAAARQLPPATRAGCHRRHGGATLPRHDVSPTPRGAVLKQCQRVDLGAAATRRGTCARWAIPAAAAAAAAAAAVAAVAAPAHASTRDALQRLQRCVGRRCAGLVTGQRRQPQRRRAAKCAAAAAPAAAAAAALGQAEQSGSRCVRHAAPHRTRCAAAADAVRHQQRREPAARDWAL